MVWVRTPEGDSTWKIQRRRREGDVKINVTVTRCDDVDWIHVAQDRER
jgi:hypothetical protein